MSRTKSSKKVKGWLFGSSNRDPRRTPNPIRTSTGIRQRYAATFNRFFGDHHRLRKIVIGILGASVLLIGALMILLPGPAIVVIPAGLAILATEFGWARVLLKRMRKKLE